jgi:prophage antirepressor-like protein
MSATLIDMNDLDTLVSEVQPKLSAIEFTSGPYFFAADVCRELGLWYARSIRYVHESDIYYFPRRDTEHLRPRHRVMLSERGLRTLAKVALAKRTLRKCA